MHELGHTNMSSTSSARAFDRQRLLRLADWMAFGVAASLPWSTSATSILIALWLIAVVPTLTVPSLARSCKSRRRFAGTALAYRGPRYVMG